jgi:hypothetical protein
MRDVQIGIGGVMAQVAFMDSPVDEDKLVKGLMSRFDVDEERATRSVNTAKICGVIRLDGGKVSLVHRPITPEDREAQRRSFAYGNAKLSNENVTRDMVDAEKMKVKP